MPRLLYMLAVLTLFSLPTSAQVTVSDPGQGAVTLAPGTAGASELSGLAWDGAAWMAVSDAVGSGAKVFDLALTVASADGTLSGQAVTGSTTLAAGGDPEGLVISSGELWVSDEIGPAVRRFSRADGSLLGDITVPAVFAGIRANFGLESLARGRGGELWTANEEALSSDGPLSTDSAGTIVRLQRFDASLAADGQWAYVTDPHPGGTTGIERSGVAELVVLDDGTLVALERAVSSVGALITRHRLYAVDFSGATDTGALTDLSGGGFTPVGKTLLHEFSFNAAVQPINLEGMAVGPALAGGRRALVLVSDDGDSAEQVLYPLTVWVERGFADGFESGLLTAWSASVP